MDLKGKQLSLMSKLLAGVLALVLSLLKGFGIIDLLMTDILLLGTFLALLFSPVDVSLWIENIKCVKKV
jgi:hypothetical protein